MKKQTLALFLLLIPSVAFPQWGPKIKFEVTNDAKQRTNLYIGVDSNATDGYDKDVLFIYEADTLHEDMDLPPPPPKSMYVLLVKDSLNPYGSYSYVDMRSIPSNSFFHKYRINIRWYNTGNPWVNIHWGKLPSGIDSAKIHCYEWFDESYFFDMKGDTALRLDNEAYQNCDIYIWYNQNSALSDEPNVENYLTIFPNPVGDFLTFVTHSQITSYDNLHYSIYSMAGEQVLANSINTNMIDVSSLMPGCYSIIIKNSNGDNIYNNFIKK
ncbi:MAG: T9SS type A sorting domain-containing protein [Ignavibacteria bacterium]|jgi:hypothetical protein|nr:T9SS type A sorting domain-containing protein [Ignavibacteria bacterium]